MARCTAIERAQCQHGSYCETFSVHEDPNECWKLKRQRREKPMTNADRIRAMSDEELAELFRDVYNAGGEYAENWYLSGSRTSCFTWDEEWLRQPAEGVG